MFSEFTSGSLPSSLSEGSQPYFTENKMGSKRAVVSSGRLRKNAAGPIFVSRNVQNLYDNQLALRRLFRWMFLPAQLSGVLPLWANNKVRVSFVLSLWTVATQLYMSKVVYDVTTSFLVATTKSNETALGYAEESGKLFIAAYIVLSTISFLWRRRLFDEIVRRFLVCQLLLSQIGFQYRFHNYLKPMILHLPIVLAFGVEFSSRLDAYEVYHLSFKYLCEFIVSSIVVIFIQLIHLSGDVLSHLNQQMLLMMASRRFGKFRKVGIMSDCQHHLCSACQSANSLHSFPLVFLFLSIFVKTVVLIFKVVTVASSVTKQQVIIFASVLGAYVMRSYYVVYICSRTAEQTRMFNKYLFEMILFESGTENPHIRKLMLHLEMKREVEFHAKGFFVVDYPLLHSIAAAATSYLVILVQTSSKT